jgi:hypothetical protein
MIDIIYNVIKGLSYINILLLLLGIMMLLRKQKIDLFLFYFTVLIGFEVLALFWIDSIWLLPTSSYVHVFFLTFFFFIYVLQFKQRNVLLLSFVLALPLLYELSQGYSIVKYDPFSYLFYDFCIVVLMLYLLYRNLQQTEEKVKVPYALIFVTIVYFSFDFVVAVTSNYLINEHLNLVGWVWLLRAFCLTTFYFFIVKFSVQ